MRQRGFTLMEMLLVIAIIGAFVYFMFNLFGTARDTAAAVRTSGQVASIIADASSMFSGSASATDCTTANGIALGIIPDDMVSGTAAVNSYGGAVTLAGTTVGTSGATNACRLIFVDVSEDDCPVIVTRTEQLADVITVDGSTTVKAYGADLVIGTVATACAGDSDIQWDFRVL